MFFFFFLKVGFQRLLASRVTLLGAPGSRGNQFDARTRSGGEDRLSGSLEWL